MKMNSAGSSRATSTTKPTWTLMTPCWVIRPPSLPLLWSVLLAGHSPKKQLKWPSMIFSEWKWWLQFKNK
jgi:hypothetical protein